MQYLPITIKEVVDGINSKYFLPHIQRELVWQPSQMKKLFDSVMRGYPISTFLFWKITNRKNDITKLELIQRYDKNSKNEINTDTDRDEYRLILDGQQRLQTFFIALKGTYSGKELFFNVLSKEVIEEMEEETEIIYETNFFKKKEAYFIHTEENKKTKKQIKKLWVRIKAFCLMEEDVLYKFIQELKERYGKEITFDETNIMDTNIQKMNSRMCKEHIFYFMEEKEDYDRVLDIFIRTNSGGTKLTKSDLLFSVIKLKWETDAYTEFSELRKRINEKGDDFEFDYDFILKTCLVLLNKDIKYKVENFNEKNVMEIEKNWKKIKESIEITVDLLVNNLGIRSKKQLTSKNSIIPLIHYTFVNNIRTYQTDNQEVKISKNHIKKWLFSALLTNLFSSQTDELLRRFRESINQNKGPFPIQELNSNLPSGKSLEINRENFDKITYNSGMDFLVLSLLYSDFEINPISDTNKPHKDHIFPESELESNKYETDLINNIGNLQFLTATENEAKNKKPFTEWIKNTRPEFIDRSMIPNKEDLWNIDKYSDFVKERRELMFARINQIIS